jgi:hypothetical protein
MIRTSETFVQGRDIGLTPLLLKGLRHAGEPERR